MKKLFLLAAVLALSACETDSDTVTKVRVACATDAAIRPAVDALLPNASPEQVAAVRGARVVIDSVCADPAKPLEASAVQGLVGAVAVVTSTYIQLHGGAASAPGK